MNTRNMYNLLVGGLAGGGVGGVVGGPLLTGCLYPELQREYFFQFAGEEIANNPKYKSCALVNSFDEIITCSDRSVDSYSFSVKLHNDANHEASSKTKTVFYIALAGSVFVGAVSLYYWKKSSVARVVNIERAINMAQDTGKWINHDRLEAIGFVGEIPEKFIDPIKGVIMDHPRKVTGVTGPGVRFESLEWKIYDAKTLAVLDGKCPLTRGEITGSEVDEDLQNEINAFVAGLEAAAYKGVVAESKSDPGAVVIPVRPESAKPQSPKFLYTSNNPVGPEEKNEMPDLVRPLLPSNTGQ